MKGKNERDRANEKAKASRSQGAEYLDRVSLDSIYEQAVYRLPTPCHMDSVRVLNLEKFGFAITPFVACLNIETVFFLHKLRQTFVSIRGV